MIICATETSYMFKLLFILLVESEAERAVREFLAGEGFNC